MDSNSAARCLSISEFDEPSLKQSSQTNLNSCQPAASLPSNKIVVEPSKIEFFYEKFKQCYPMYKNPRGQCLIINIYQINGMPPRRWSDRDTEALKQLFEQLLFSVTIYTDSTHDLSCQNFIKIVSDFSKLEEHEDAQCCVICLMSHGEEGFLTTKEGNKVPLDDIFSMFNNVNCPNLAGKPKLFFIQSCRDDPITGPAEDLGIRISYTTAGTSTDDLKADENDSGSHSNQSNSGEQTDNNQALLNDSCLLSPPPPSEQRRPSSPLDDVNDDCYDFNTSNSTLQNSNSSNSLSQIFYHIPSLCDMIIGFPTQKGFIAYRKPEIGSWYMNAIVNVFSRYAHNTDLCAMLNMVNLLISNEVTNTGKKQMSEYTSKLTKPYFYFFPGLASETNVQSEASTTHDSTQIATKNNQKSNELTSLLPGETNTSSIICEPSPKRQCMLRANLSSLDQNDSNWHHQRLMTMLNPAQNGTLRNWKHLGRELGLGEAFIREFAREHSHENDNEKLNSLVQYLCENRSLSTTNNKNRPMIQYGDKPTKS